MKKRILTGIVGIAFLAGVLAGSWYWPLAFNIAVAIICAVSASEILTATGLGKYKILAAGVILFAAFVPFSVYVAELTRYPVVQAVFLAYCLFLFSHAIFHHHDIAFPDLAVVFAVSVVVPYALSTMVYARDIGGVHGIYYIKMCIRDRVDGVYDSDPKKNPDAVRYDKISFGDVLSHGLQVMDSTAASMCRDNKIPILVFSMEDPHNIVRAMSEGNIGTIVTE